MIKLIVDRKVATWIRTEIEVEAGSVREAVDNYNSAGMKGCHFLTAYEITGIRRPLLVTENGHMPTLEIYSPDKPGELWDNKTGHFYK